MKLSSVVNRINGNVDRFTTDLKYYIGGEHFESNELAITKKGLLKENLNILGFKFHFAFQERDVIFMARNPHLRKAGMVMFSGLCSDASYILRSKDENILTQEFLAVQLQSDHFWDYCESHKVGSVNFANNWSSIANYEFDLPPIEVQRKIGEKVWAAYHVKESYKKLLAATDDMLKAKFQEMFGDCDSSIEGLSFEEVFTIKDNLRCPLNDTTRKDMHKGDELYPYYGANGLVDHINQYKIDMTAICLAEDCGKYGPGEETAYIIHGKSWVNNHAHILVPKDNCDIVYAKMLFTIMDLNKYVDNDNRKKLTQANMKKIKILCPPLPLQQQFVEIATQAEATKESLRKSIENIDQVIKSLINQ